MYIDDIKHCQKRKRILNPNIGNEDIQWRYRDGIWLWKLCYVNIEKRKTANGRKNRTAKSRKHENAHKKKVAYKYLGILEADIIKYAEMKEKPKIPLENEKISRNQTINQKSNQRKNT